MRLNAVIFCILAGLGTVFVVCSRSDIISGVAERVVSDADSLLTGPDRFVRVDLDSGDADAYSLPAAADPAFSTTFTDSSFIVGVNGENDVLAAYIQYNIAADSLWKSRIDTINKTDTSLTVRKVSFEPESVYLHFPPDSAAADSISVYWVNPLLDNSEPVNSVDKIHYPKPCTSPNGGNGVNGNDDGGCEPTTDSLLLKIPFHADSAAKLDTTTDIAQKIFKAKTSGVSDTVAFNVYYYQKKPRRVQPYMVIAAYKITNDTVYGITKVPVENDPAKLRDSLFHVSDTTLSDTVTATVRAKAARFTAFENADSALARTKTAYTSRYTKRTAVFKINLGKIKRALGERQGKYASLDAVITIKPGNNPNKPGLAAGNYRIFVSDTLFRDSDTANLNQRFGSASKSSLSARSATPYNTFSISDSTSINPSLQRVLDSQKEALYVYLRADSDDGAIIWGRESIGVQTVFTRLPR